MSIILRNTFIYQEISTPTYTNSEKDIKVILLCEAEYFKHSSPSPCCWTPFHKRLYFLISFYHFLCLLHLQEIHSIKHLLTNLFHCCIWRENSNVFLLLELWNYNEKIEIIEVSQVFFLNFKGNLNGKELYDRAKLDAAPGKILTFWVIWRCYKRCTKALVIMLLF